MTKNINIFDNELNYIVEDINQFLEFEKLCNTDRYLREEFHSYFDNLVKEMEKNSDVINRLNKILYIIYDIYYLTVPNNYVSKISPLLYILQHKIEEKIYSIERDKITIPSDFPWDDNKKFTKYLLKSIEEHPSNNESFYLEYLPNKASLEDLKYYFTQESQLDGRFDDLLAFTQVGIPNKYKLELAKNYWDEMGNGKISEIHTVLFNHILEELEIDTTSISNILNHETIKSANLSTYLAMNRSKFYNAIGFLGTIEYAGPKRFRKIIEALSRNNMSKKALKYHILHEKIDIIHSNDWFKKVIAPLAINEYYAKEIYVGVMMRLNTSHDYLAELKNKLNIKE